MNERDPRGLAGAWTRFQRHAGAAPSADLAGHVERYWVAHWRYDRPYRQLVVPYPNVHLIFSRSGVTVTGPTAGHQVRVLEGSGGVLGVTFRPGSFRPFLGAPVRSIRDRVIDADVIFGTDLPVLAEPPQLSDVPRVEDLLRARLPGPDPQVRAAIAAVDTVTADPTITTVELLADRLGVGVRRLQRLFAEHVGLSPKRVIRRYRLREVTERMAAGTPINWAALAADLGFADQAHLVRDFTGIFGESPARYQQRYPVGGSRRVEGQTGVAADAMPTASPTVT